MLAKIKARKAVTAPSSRPRNQLRPAVNLDTADLRSRRLRRIAARRSFASGLFREERDRRGPRRPRPQRLAAGASPASAFCRKKRILRFVACRGKKRNGVSSLEAEIEPRRVELFPSGRAITAWARQRAGSTACRRQARRSAADHPLLRAGGDPDISLVPQRGDVDLQRRRTNVAPRPVQRAAGRGLPWQRDQAKMRFIAGGR